MHSFRRANITWQQEVGASAIETSKIAGHASTKTTEQYTVVQLKRQEELTRRIQEKLTEAVSKAKKQEAVAVDEAAMLTYGVVDLSGISAD